MTESAKWTMSADLLILCATPFEVSHFLSLCPDTSNRMLKTGQKILSGRIKSQSYDLLISGAGVFNAIQALTAYLISSKPSLVVNTGIAGVFKLSGNKIGDVAVADQEHYIHTGVQTGGVKNEPLPFDLIDQSPLSRQGIYSMDGKIVDHIHEKVCQAFSADDSIKILKGGFITVSTITASFEKADDLYEAFSPLMEAMEGAACAHSCACHNIPMVQIRSASNFVGERDKSNWNIELAVKNLGSALAEI